MPPAYGTCEVHQSNSLSSSSFTSEEKTRLVLRRPLETNYLIPKRYIFSILCFTAGCLAVSFNVNLSIAIVSMVNHSNSTLVKNTSLTNDSNSSQPENIQLHWTSEMEGTALGAVYYGQLVSFIPGGRLAELYGGKRMIILCTLIASIATAALPCAAIWSAAAFVIVRIIVGLGTGPIIPIVFHMLARWIPQDERSFHASFILSGYGVGSFLAVIVSGAMCGSTFLGGWPSVFYTGAFFGIIWCFLCYYFMCETPDIHPTINEEEYLKITFARTHKKNAIPHIPWKEMSLSVPLWALAIGFFGQFWLLGFFSTVHALYMGTVLKLPIVQNGILSCLPHLLRAFATCLASYPVDLMLKRETVSVGFIRKAATVINSVVSCGAFLAITFVGTEVTTTAILFVVGGILGEFVTFGVCLAAVDIAPHLSGTVSGILNIVGVFPFFLIPALVGLITAEENTFEQWRKVFYTTIAIVSATTFIFVVFGDLRPQDWGTAKSSKSKREETNELQTNPKSMLTDYETESQAATEFKMDDGLCI